MNGLWIPGILLLLSATVSANDEDLRELVNGLRDQVQRLNARVEELERQLAPEKSATMAIENPKLPRIAEQPKPVQATSARSSAAAESPGRTPSPGDFKGSIKIPGTDTSVAIGGYVKLDALYNSISAGKDQFGDQLLAVSSIPVGSDALRGEQDQISVHAKESRFWLKSFTPSPYGDVNAYLELDLYGAADNHIPRLRHAYGSIGALLAGQTWSTFLNVQAIPETNDIGGPVGLGLLRQPLIRWSQPLVAAERSLELQAALETPRSRWARDDSAVVESPDDDQVPDLIVRLNYNPDWGTISLAGLGRQIRFADTNGSVRAHWGAALALAGKINTDALDNIRFTFTYGNVLARYINSGNGFADAVFESSGPRSQLIDAYSAMIAYQHWWNAAWRSSLVYSYARSELPEYANDSLTQQAQSLHANLFWSPIPRATIGLEYIYATRFLKNDLHGGLHRLQFSTRFNF